MPDGASLPLLWHWAYFAPTVSSAQLGADGHPRLPANGPTAALPRRMWAGGRVVRHGPMRVGEPAVRRSAVIGAEHKVGRSGPLLVIGISHRIEQRGELVIEERQDLVYLPTGGALALPVDDRPPEVPADGWVELVQLDPVRLFRFSALTFNSHRIHFDREYANTQEGYPDLVVHGPLTALLLAGSSRRRLGHDSVFEFRAKMPLFVSAPFTIVGQLDGAAASLRAVRNDGSVAMAAAQRIDRDDRVGAGLFPLRSW